MSIRTADSGFSEQHRPEAAHDPIARSAGRQHRTAAARVRCEGNTCPTDDEVTARENLTRAKITTLVRVDARHPRPVDRTYPTVVSAYCADSATGDRATWELFMRHITGLVEPGGLFVTAALRRCRGYTVGGTTFPGADIDERDLRATLRPGFDLPYEGIEVVPTAQHGSHGYAAILLCRARRTQPSVS